MVAVPSARVLLGLPAAHLIDNRAADFWQIWG
jgi:hypothetical protein